MNFNSYLLKPFRILLFPFSLLYSLVVAARNFLFDKNILKSVEFELPIICVGNVSAGGTGKTPMVEYLITLLQSSYKVATLSRGYKRKTKGYVLANAETTELEIGDEPMQFHNKFPDVAVAVGEERVLAIPRLLQDCPETGVIILDDAFQHRSVRPGFNILLTEYSNLFTRDFFLPSGHLRDQRSSGKRAEIIVVTKCPAEMLQEEKTRIQKEIRPLANQQVFFSAIQYGLPYHILTKEERSFKKSDAVLLVCGIANPKPLKHYLDQSFGTCRQLSFSDHHLFSLDDLTKVKMRYDNMQDEQKIIITTEKDAVKLVKFKHAMSGLPIFVLPVQHRFLFGDGVQFDQSINNFVESFNS